MTQRSSRNRRELDAGYSVEVDAVTEGRWYDVLEEFSDANIYQTWAYEATRARLQKMSHLVLRKDGAVVAAAQARLVALPFIKAGIAYVRWGPMWRRRSLPPDADVFRQAVRALRNEYACRRGLVIRLRPALFKEFSPEFAAILADEGYASRREPPERTLHLDLTRSTGELSAAMRPHWRRQLRKAEKGGLEVVEGAADPLFGDFIRLYREMVRRKRFAEPNDISHFRSTQQRLPPHLKMRILLSKKDGESCSGLVCSAMGDTAIYLFGATSDSALETRGSYLLHWTLIRRLKDFGTRIYDLHGINPEANPGTYRFKAGLCGGQGTDLHFLGQFDAYSSSTSYGCVVIAEQMQKVVRAMRRRTPLEQGPAEAAKPDQAGQA